MGYRIEGDGSYRNTFVWLDNELQEGWDTLLARVDEERCEALLCPDCDTINGWKPLDRMIISSLYMIVSDGNFTNTRVIVEDEMLRGVQQVVIQIDKDEHPMINIRAVLLPNILENPE